MSPSSPIRDVSDTARWVAFCRAKESERPDALFRDPYARRLAGERGEAIVDAVPRARTTLWPMIVRTAVIDEIVLDAVARRGVRTVVNLAAGLDTRPFRLPLPASLRWLHVDLPAQIDAVRGALDGEAPVCALEWVAADLTDPRGIAEALDRVSASGRPALAISEGLLVYLRPDRVEALARALASTEAVRWWLIDLASPRLLAMLRKRWQPILEAAGTPMVFAPAQGTEFFAPLGWREADYRSIWTEAGRLGRAPRGAAFWNLVARLMPARKRREIARTSGVVLLERGEDARAGA